MKLKLVSVLLGAAALLAQTEQDVAAATASNPNIGPLISRAPSPSFDEDLWRSVRRSFGPLRRSFLIRNGLVSDQVALGQSIPDPNIQPYIRLSDGNFLVSGCRHHSCDEKATIVSTPNGEMLGAALIHFGCVFEKPKPKECIYRPRLTIFVNETNDVPARINQMTRWARQVSVNGYKPVAMVQKIRLP